RFATNPALAAPCDGGLAVALTAGRTEDDRPGGAPESPTSCHGGAWPCERLRRGETRIYSERHGRSPLSSWQRGCGYGNSSATGHEKPGSTSSPLSTSPLYRMLDSFPARKTATERSSGTKTQTRRTPAFTYSCTFC